MTTFTEGFDKITVTRMQSFFRTLSEKDKRRYAALEAQRLSYGGIGYIAEILGCSIRTISRGIAELDSLDNDPAHGRVRQPGGGRKKRLPPARTLSKT